MPCSNQLSYQVTQQLSGWVRVLKAELPGIQPKLIPSWHVQWGGCGECEVQGTGSDFRHAPDLTVIVDLYSSPCGCMQVPSLVPAWHQGEGRGGGRVLGVHCLCMCLVPMVTCILLKSWPILVYLLKGHTACFLCAGNQATASQAMSHVHRRLHANTNFRK